MNKKVSRIEQLDLQFPGLADEVRKWLAQGISSKKIAELLPTLYPVSVKRWTVGKFRSRVWVPEQALLREKKIEAQAQFEVERDRAVKLALAAGLAGPEE